MSECCNFAASKSINNFKNRKKIMAVFYKMMRNEMKCNQNYGRYYAHTVRMGRVGLEELEGLIEKRCTATRGDVRLVLMELVDVMQEELQAGKVVELDGFGRFALSVRGECVDRPEEFSPDEHVKGLHCNFTPAGRRRGMGDGTISRRFYEGCEVKEAPLYDKP